MIHAADGAILASWPVRRLVLRAHDDGAATLSQRGGQARLVLRDPALLAALPLRTPRRGWAVPLALCMALVLAAGLAVHALPGLLAPLVPARWEAALGQGAQALLLAGNRQCGGTDGTAALDRLTARLAAAAGITIPVHLTVADGSMVNAFTLPGGRVVLMRGLIETSGDGDELAGVLAHELGHVRHRDPTTQMLRQLGLGAVASALGWGGTDPGGLAPALIGLSYGRAAEAAADEAAVAALQRAGLRADGLARFFARIEAEDHAPARILSDHPPTAERRRLAEQPPTGEPAFTAAEWRDVRAVCG